MVLLYEAGVFRCAVSTLVRDVPFHRASNWVAGDQREEREAAQAGIRLAGPTSLSLTESC